VVIGAFIMPPYLGAIGWILLAGPNSGFLNLAWRWLTGSRDPLFNVYSFPAWPSSSRCIPSR
jgi:iron(III) transport system permease protein